MKQLASTLQDRSQLFFEELFPRLYQSFGDMASLYVTPSLKSKNVISIFEQINANSLLSEEERSDIFAIHVLHPTTERAQLSSIELHRGDDR
jgi:hypothetical protein